MNDTSARLARHGRSRRRFLAPDCGAPVLPLFGKSQTFRNVRGAGRSPVVSPHLCLRVQKPCYTAFRCCKGRFAAPEPSNAQRPRSAPPAARLWRVLQTRLHMKILSACIVAGGRPDVGGTEKRRSRVEPATEAPLSLMMPAPRRHVGRAVGPKRAKFNQAISNQQRRWA